ncbi:MAG TPA: aminotransferase [Rhodobacteraceae bacterium]|jgi:cystathionine beta-lyase|nr:aminotransferase [Paracoccaceae bacterium]HBV55851.1 aminotransferase [Paracoccaceae bacterium]
MSFDDIIDRRNTHSVKWDVMEALYGVPAEEGLSMWVADMDFRAPDCIQAAVQKMRDHGVYGYYGDDAAYRAAIQWWMKERHGWSLNPKAIFTTHGLVNGTAMCVDTFTKPGDGVLLFTPVYHAFAKVIRANDRRVVESPLVMRNGRYEMDFDHAAEAVKAQGASMVILCSPHNPSGRVWERAELEALAAFATEHELVLVSDEIHHDLVFSGAKHIPMTLVTGNEGCIMMTASTKTFNIAGSHSGNVIIHEPQMRAKFEKRMMGLGLSPNSFGLFMAEAAYSPEGAAWVDQCVSYIGENARVFDEGVNSIPGVISMKMASTYLAWVDFSGTGMSPAEVQMRVEKEAKIAANHGATFGTGGESFMRFNLAMPRVQIEEAVVRLKAAFADLQ